MFRKTDDQPKQSGQYLRSTPQPTSGEGVGGYPDSAKPAASIAGRRGLAQRIFDIGNAYQDLDY